MPWQAHARRRPARRRARQTRPVRCRPLRSAPAWRERPIAHRRRRWPPASAAWPQVKARERRMAERRLELMVTKGGRPTSAPLRQQAVSVRLQRRAPSVRLQRQSPSVRRVALPVGIACSLCSAVPESRLVSKGPYRGLLRRRAQRGSEAGRRLSRPHRARPVFLRQLARPFPTSAPPAAQREEARRAAEQMGPVRPFRAQHRRPDLRRAARRSTSPTRAPSGAPPPGIPEKR